MRLNGFILTKWGECDMGKRADEIRAEEQAISRLRAIVTRETYLVGMTSSEARAWRMCRQALDRADTLLTLCRAEGDDK